MSSQQDDSLARELAGVVAVSRFATLVVAMPAQQIVAASSAAMRLLDPLSGSVVGRTLEEFTADRPSGGLALFAEGRLSGVEALRVLRRSDGAGLPVRMWFGPFGHQPPGRFVQIVIAVRAPAGSFVQSGKSRADAAMVGTADAGLLIERISGDAETLFGCAVDDLIGRPLITLVAEHDVPNCLVALDEASNRQRGVSLYVDLRAAGVGDPAQLAPLGCEVLILPLRPSPSCAFVFLPSVASMSRTHVASDLGALLVRMGRGAETAELPRRLPSVLTGRTVAGLNRLTPRELDLLTRLLQGDRVPAIALELFVTQSTVRSHLGSIFFKVGVTSQQELLDLFRGARPIQ